MSDKQDNNYLIKTFKGEYTNCNENLFVKISPIKNEIQYIKEQLQQKSKKITVEKYNECSRNIRIT